MSAAGDIEQAFALFKQLRDARTWRCDYRYTELEAFQLAIASLAPASAEQYLPIDSCKSAGQRQKFGPSQNKVREE